MAAPSHSDWSHESSTCVSKMKELHASEADISEIDEQFTDYADPFKGMETHGKQRRRMLKTGKLVDPEAVELGHTFEPTTASDGSVGECAALCEI